MDAVKQLQLQLRKSLSLPLYPFFSLRSPFRYHNIPLMSYSSTLIPIRLINCVNLTGHFPDEGFDKSISTLTYVFS